MKRKSYIFLLLISFALSVSLYSLKEDKNTRNDALNNNYANTVLNSEINTDELIFNEELNKFYRNTNLIDYSNIKFIPWDVELASSNIEKRQKNPYTIMIYMNGSDLESENAAATKDIIEMLESNVNSDYVNLILFTGGTNRWRNDVIPENECVLWEISYGKLHEITRVGLVNMGNPGTLTSFIDFSVNNFPAERYGLIMWDHGGGAISGYGHDEKFNNSNLTLLDMNYAFEMSNLRDNKLEFLGFDSCLMATVEMAIVASNYAKYLIASEDLEPGDGWDYYFLSVLNDNPHMDGVELGKSIVDYFMNYYGRFSDDFLALSVTDLSKVNLVMGAMGNLMNKCSNSLLIDNIESFKTISKRRNMTKTFGQGSPRDNECDMVDIGDMAYKLSDIFPNEALNIINQLEKCVLYNRHNSNVDLKGLSSYYIYGGKQFGDYSLKTYDTLNMNTDYTQYLYDFYEMLNRNVYSRNIQSTFNYDNKDNLISSNLTLWKPGNKKQNTFLMIGIKNQIDINCDQDLIQNINSLWPKINDQHVCMYKINNLDNRSLYAIPSKINEKDCDLLVMISNKYPDGKILGIRQYDGLIIQKGFDEIQNGDKISFYYQEKSFIDNSNQENINWKNGDEFTIESELELEWSKIDKENIFYSLLLTDIWHNEYFTDLKEIS